MAICNSRGVPPDPIIVIAMGIYGSSAPAKDGDQSAALTLASRPSLRQWITPHDIEALREPLAQGHLPPDLLRKLQRLAGGTLGQRFIEQQCHLFAALLLSDKHGSFRQINPAERERLLRVLAYVRKEQDAIPDDQLGGFADDQEEVRAAAVALTDLLQAYKVWRLRFQVPTMWQDHDVTEAA